MKMMREAGLIVARLHEEMRKLVLPGVTTRELDRFADDFIRSAGAKPAFKGVVSSPDLPPFPGVICASVNEELVHGVPSDRELEEGDIISIDTGCLYRGFYSDAARTWVVGEGSKEAVDITETCRRCLEEATKVLVAGNRLFDIGKAVESVALPKGYSIVTEYVGHGIGTELWEEPQVPNFVPKFPDQRNPRFSPGLVLAVEPMINSGTSRTARKRGSWVVRTADNKLCAHWENTIAVLENGNAVLTETTPCELD
jgi:methionyl aminopeptidase